MTETLHKIGVSVAATLLGIIVGWGAQSLTIAGRVTAIEQGQARLEVLMLQVIQMKQEAAK